MLIAIYSRKSRWTGRGDSVENQVLMCREYIAGHIEDGENAEILVYEDEGFSGKDTRRPRFQKMLADMQARHFSYLVCYRLDRLGRNIADLAFLMEKLNREQTAFVSIKEQFDTTSPMGKAMLYFAGVLAQMEREQIAERVRDNMYMLARSGRWLGGNPPLGFQAKKKTVEAPGGKTKKIYFLERKEEESAKIRFLFQEFLKSGSLKETRQIGTEYQICTRNGKPYTTAALRNMLSNPVYCTADKEAYAYFLKAGCQMCMEEWEADGSRGFISYAKTVSQRYKGEETGREHWILALGAHRGILTGKEYVAVQNILESHRLSKKQEANGIYQGQIHSRTALLPGLLFCTCQSRMRPKYYGKSEKSAGNRRFSYRCPQRDQTCGTKCQVPAVQGNTLDTEVWKKLIEITEERLSFSEILRKAENSFTEKESPAFSREKILEAEIRKKQKEIRNLTAAVARWREGTFALTVKEEIEARAEELRKLEEQKKACLCVDRERTEKKERAMLEGVRDFTSFSSLLTIQEKRNYTAMFVKQAVWDGKQVRIK